MYGPRLAGFPVHVCYVDLGGADGPNRATYYFDPRTFSQDSEVRRMQYYAERESRFWVEVVISKIGGRIEIGKYRDETVVSAATGPDFRAAMIQAAIAGLKEDEPADES